MVAEKITSKPKKTGIKVPYYTKSGVKSGTVVLPKEIFGQKPNKVLIAQAVRVFLANQRSAHAKTLGRGEINRTKHKAHRQKGTGLARHGAKSAPIYVGGGIAHGPRGIENYKLNLSQKMRKLALISSLSEKAQEGKVVVADIESVEPKTKNIASVLEKIGGKSVTIVHGGSKNLVLAARNIEVVVLIPASGLSAYNVLVNNILVLTKEGVLGIESRLK